MHHLIRSSLPKRRCKKRKLPYLFYIPVRINKEEKSVGILEEIYLKKSTLFTVVLCGSIPPHPLQLLSQNDPQPVLSLSLSSFCEKRLLRDVFVS
jgi:hypothetical protein